MPALDQGGGDEDVDSPMPVTVCWHNQEDMVMDEMR